VESLIDTYLEKALVGDYPLLGTGEVLIVSYDIDSKIAKFPVLHPSIRLAYFEDESKWDELVAMRARMLLEHLYEVYKEDTPSSKGSVPKPPAAASVFLDAIRNLSPAQQKAAISELEAYFNGTNPCLDGDALKWWKVNPVYPTDDISIG
jgi:hypothetical protein